MTNILRPSFELESLRVTLAMGGHASCDCQSLYVGPPACTLLIPHKSHIFCPVHGNGDYLERVVVAQHWGGRELDREAFKSYDAAAERAFSLQRYFITADCDGLLR